MAFHLVQYFRWGFYYSHFASVEFTKWGNGPCDVAAFPLVIGSRWNTVVLLLCWNYLLIWQATLFVLTRHEGSIPGRKSWKRDSATCSRITSWFCYQAVCMCRLCNALRDDAAALYAYAFTSCLLLSQKQDWSYVWWLLPTVVKHEPTPIVAFEDMKIPTKSSNGWCATMFNCWPTYGSTYCLSSSNVEGSDFYMIYRELPALVESRCYIFWGLRKKGVAPAKT